MKPPIFVTKASGESVLFSEEKLRNSLRRSGADEQSVAQITQRVKEKLYDGISTRKIYRFAFDMLKQRSRPVAARYHLKKAIMELGPSGFPFEKYVGELFRWRGYEINTGVVHHGKCVSHELDVIAWKREQFLMVECKYHNQPGIICDVKIPLYVHSRFRDLQSEWMKVFGEDKKYEVWIVNNTRFSSDAILYGNCAGINLLGWDFPAKAGLKEMIDKLALYPVTCLVSLTRYEKQNLLASGIVLCHDLLERETLLSDAGVPAARLAGVMDEVKKLCYVLSNGDKKQEQVWHSV